MLKKLALVVLLSISSLKATDMPKIGCMDTIKNSHGVSMWLGAIIPSILGAVSAEVVLRSNNDCPDRKDIVIVSKVIKFLSLLIGAILVDEWLRTDFKEWLVKK